MTGFKALQLVSQGFLTLFEVVPPRSRLWAKSEYKWLRRECSQEQGNRIGMGKETDKGTILDEASDWDFALRQMN